MVDDDAGGSGQVRGHRLLLPGDHVHHVDAVGVPVRVEEHVVEHHHAVDVEHRVGKERQLLLVRA